MSKSTPADQEIDAAKLHKLLDEATGGPWHIDTGVMADSLYITAYERAPSYRDYDKHDGPICHVATEKRHFHTDKDRFGESRSWKTPIKKARADAELIVAAVNALPELLRRAGLSVDATGWLIECNADKFGPVRWYAAGEPLFVIDSNNATRFARKVDAETVIRAEKLSGVTATEHMWMTAPKKREKAAA